MNIENIDAKYGIYIRGKKIMEMILDGIKQIETRTHDKLKRFEGQRVALILTGYGKPKIVGYAYILCCHQFKSEVDFRAWEFLHKIAKGSKYDWDPNKQKYGYLLRGVEKLDSPIELESIQGNRMWRKLK